MALQAKFVAFLNHPAGPKTIHFWAPAFKWGLVVAGISDMKRPVDQISGPQSIALSSTGLIWSRYATQITPVNYNLLSVNVFVAMTGLYQLSRKYLGVEYVAIFPFEKHGPYDPFGDYTIFPSDAFSSNLAQYA